MRGPPAAVALLVLLLAGCGGGTNSAGPNASASTSTAQSKTSTSTPAPTSGQSTRNCTALNADDLVRVASLKPSKQGTLAAAPGQSLRCSRLFVDSSGQLILQLTEAGGGRPALTSLRRATAADAGARAIQPVPKLGPGAFVGGRVLGFILGNRLVTLQTGYTASGMLELSPDQLVRLAAIVRAH
jgi:hypothetical protein